MKKYVLLMAVLVASLPSGLAAQEKKDPVQAPPPAAPAPAPLKPPVVRAGEEADKKAAPAAEEKAPTLAGVMTLLMSVKAEVQEANKRLDGLDKRMDALEKRFATFEEIVKHMKHLRKVYKKDEIAKEGVWTDFGYEYAYKDGGLFVFHEGFWRLAVKTIDYREQQYRYDPHPKEVWFVSWSDAPWTIVRLQRGSLCK